MLIFNPKKILRINMLVLAGVLVSSCSSPYKYQPRDNGSNQHYQKMQNASSRCQSPYVVKAGDTLSAIARECKVNMLSIAKINDLLPPYIIYVKQELDLPFEKVVSHKPVNNNEGLNHQSDKVVVLKQPEQEVAFKAGSTEHKTTSKPSNLPANDTPVKPPHPTIKPETSSPKDTVTKPKAVKVLKDTSGTTATAISRKPEPSDVSAESSESKDWIWPMHKGLEYKYRRDSAGLSVLEIYGVPGQTVHAVTDGTVVYSGNGIANYGWMLVIKHSNDYMSIYAHNSSLLVEEGDKVEAGEEIALLGATGVTPRPKLYVEARQNGRKIDIKKILKP